eukprot:scaffold7328_cov314-Pinguiococcus_pyrenoidosus.AAC.77
MRRQAALQLGVVGTRLVLSRLAGRHARARAFPGLLHLGIVGQDRLQQTSTRFGEAIACARAPKALRGSSSYTAARIFHAPLRPRLRAPRRFGTPSFSTPIRRVWHAREVQRRRTWQEAGMFARSTNFLASFKHSSRRAGGSAAARALGAKGPPRRSQIPAISCFRSQASLRVSSLRRVARPPESRRRCSPATYRWAFWRVVGGLRRAGAGRTLLRAVGVVRTLRGGAGLGRTSGKIASRACSMEK